MTPLRRLVFDRTAQRLLDSVPICRGVAFIEVLMCLAGSPIYSALSDVEVILGWR